MRTSLLILGVLAFGCVVEKPQEDLSKFAVCSCDQEQLGEWVLSCLKNAQGDEAKAQGDLVKSCESVAIKVHCGEGCYRSSGGGAILRSLEYEQSSEPEFKPPF